MIHDSDLVIDSNIEKIRKKASALKYAEISSFEDSVNFVRFWLADYYKVPSKSSIFDEYTVEELFFEYYYLTTPEKKVDSASIVRESAKELASLFEQEFSDEEQVAMDKMFENDVNWSLDELEKKGK
ncbi:MAG: hypothetical protein EBU90_22890 [Proteobacteria bacterium]|nr:hypothetical protein [Pseudomonadota bacterium]